MRMNDRLLSTGLAPQPPPAPEIEGYLKKLKRKTSNLSGSWNKRWFFVDIKRREFGYAATKAPGAPKSSIYLNDITAVVQFDDTHFQVESRTRNFFLCGDSKASTTCWVKSLDEYRRRLAEYEKDKAKYDASLAAAQSQLSVGAQVAFAAASGGAAAVGQMPKKVNNNSKAAMPSQHDEPSRDSFSSSSSSSSGSTSSSKRASRAAEKQPRQERRTPSPTERPAAKEKRGSMENTPSASSHKPEHDREGRERERDQEGERDRGREREKDARNRERERDRDSRARPNVTRTNSRQLDQSRSIGDASSVRAHPGKGYVMQAWVDDDI
ncbi:hypothetical protein Gpo141_00000013 [Globisporangium polare]